MISVEGHPRNISVKFILKSNNWPMRRCRLTTFSILSSGGYMYFV